MKKLFSNIFSSKNKEDLALDIKLKTSQNHSAATAKYKNTIRKHLENIEELRIKYSAALKDNDWFSTKMEYCMNICYNDISLAPLMREYDIEDKKYYTQRSPITKYSTFSKLAIIHEKRKEYDLAIDICNLALSLNYSDDGTKSGMCGRKEKLIKLREKELIDKLN